MKAFTHRVSSAIDRFFAPREIHIRSHDRVRFIRLTSGFQKSVTVCALVLSSWVMFTSGSMLATEQRLADKDSAIEEQKIEYFNLLQQVGEYHNEFSKITKNLQENQEQLLSLLDGDHISEETAAEQVHLKTSEDERARVALARQALEDKFKQFEGDLESIAGKNLALETQAKQLKQVLETSEEERSKAALAKRMMSDKLAEVQTELEKFVQKNAQLEDEKKALDNSLDELNHELASFKGQLSERGEFVAEQQAQMTSLLEGKRVALQEAEDVSQKLQETTLFSEQLKSENIELSNEVDSLKNSLVEVSNIQLELVERLTERSKSSVDVIEKTVAMTGLNLETLLGSDNLETGQGGPYIPLEDNQETAELEASVALLDMQLVRWEALQDVVGKLPLTTPLDQYRVTSSFGKRRDPVTGKTSVHNGLDMAAPMKSSIYAPAPGKVVYAGWRGRYGRLVEIDHGNGIRTRYGHLRKLLVTQGQEVAHNEKIALLGNSGRSTGPHVHYEILFNGNPVDPRKFLLAGKNVFKVQ
ncbi:M23 family metallopeptidase [Kiloniella laminariae]|uniref:M23 family metallopeptidase n=1 Tax=Kiloniella laminariae TaxID=454162 RepID=UPI0012F8D4A6|nr:M23 family metallopeptidase [Kiloniella laminariae]